MKVFLPKRFFGTELAWMERGAWTLSLCALTYCGGVLAEAEWAQRKGWDELRADKILFDSSNNLPSDASASASVPRIGGEPRVALGSLEMAASGLSAVIFDGADDFTLSRGIGHLPGSALPGQQGNVVLAGHRDTFFRKLEHVTLGENLTIQTPTADATYTVTSIHIVDPRETSVIRPTSDFRITLITCYPFHFLGHAPLRFVVTGKLVTK